MRGRPGGRGVLLAARRPGNPIGWTAAGNVVTVLAFASLLGWLALQVPRYQRAGAERREQLKCVYSGALVFVTALVASAVVPSLLGESFGSTGRWSTTR